MTKASLKKVRKNWYITKDGTIAVRAISKREALYKLSKAIGRLANWNEAKRSTWHEVIFQPLEDCKIIH